jgi:hypothetical protein
MTPRIWFTLALRVLGAWVGYDALSYLIYSLNIKLGFFSPTSSGLGSFLLRGLIEAGAAWLLLRFAPLISAHFYPESDKPD